MNNEKFPEQPDIITEEASESKTLHQRYLAIQERIRQLMQDPRVAAELKIALQGTEPQEEQSKTTLCQEVI